MRSWQAIDILKPGENGGFRLTSEEPTTLDLEWYKLGPLKPDVECDGRCVTVTDLDIKIISKIVIGRHSVTINVS